MHIMMHCYLSAAAVVWWLALVAFPSLAEGDHDDWAREGESRIFNRRVIGSIQAKDGDHVVDSVTSNSSSTRIRSGVLMNIESPNFVYAADPNAMVVGDTLYVFCSTDSPKASFKTGYGLMRSYSLLTTTDTSMPFVNHGIVLTPADKWPELTYKGKLMYAPGASYNDGWFYLYFPILGRAHAKPQIGIARSKDPSQQSNWEIVVAFVPGLVLFDPAIMLGVDGTFYMYGNSRERGQTRSGRAMIGAEMDSNATGFTSGSPPKFFRLYGGGVHEAVFVFRRTFTRPGANEATTKYYFMARVDPRSSDCIRYWMADTPLPSIPQSVPGRRLTVDQYDAPPHASIVEFQSRFYIFYHSGAVNNGNRFRRSTCMDEVFFNTDGTIVAPIKFTCPIKRHP